MLQYKIVYSSMLFAVSWSSMSVTVFQQEDKCYALHSVPCIHIFVVTLNLAKTSCLYVHVSQRHGCRARVSHIKRETLQKVGKACKWGYAKGTQCAVCHFGIEIKETCPEIAGNQASLKVLEFCWWPSLYSEYFFIQTPRLAIFFVLVQLLSEGGIYSVGKPADSNDSWISLAVSRGNES